jgi:hypothetical protein
VNRNTQQLGYLSARGIIILTIIYLIVLLLPLVTSQESGWRPAVTSYYRIEPSGGFLSDFNGSIFYFRTLLIVILFACLHDFAPNLPKVFSTISLIFVALFAALHTLSFTGQFAIRNFNINACDNECLLYYIHSLFDNYITSVNVMAFNVFSGLAELFLMPVFSKSIKIERKIRFTLLIAGTLNLLSALMFVLNNESLSVSCMLFSLIIFITFLLYYIEVLKRFKSTVNGE